MDPKVIAGIAAAISAIIAAIITAIATGFSARQRLQELRFQYETRLKDGYLEKAREYTSKLYVPLSVALAALGFAFQHFRSSSADQGAKVGQFKEAIKEFLSVAADLSSRGANAFLTTDLDETLQGFQAFLTSSLVAQEPKLKVVMMLGTTALWGGSKAGVEHVVSGKRIKFFRTPPVSFSLGPVTFAYKAEEILSAPVESAEFEERFSRDTFLINMLIKEVTLGAVARRNTQGTC